MKPVAIQKAVNVIKMGSWTSPVDFRYQDETSEFKIECDQVAAQKRNQIYTPKPWEALPYLAKGDLGKIHVRGFLHNQVAENRDGTFNHPAALSTEEIIGRLGPAWVRHAERFPKTEVSHHRLVFSMSREFHDALVRASRNPDTVLRGVIEQSMRSFQEKFHPGDSVGYSYGLHHDTDNLHAHVFVHPRTREGKFVGMSGKPKKHQGHTSRHKDQLGFLRDAARRRVTQVLKELHDPKEAAHLGNNLHADRIYFIPRQSHTARPKNDYRPRTAADFELEQKRSAIATLDRKIAEQKAALRGAWRGRNFAAVWLPRQPKWLRLMRQAQAAALFRQMRELQRKRHQLVLDYRATRRRLIPEPGATRSVPRRPTRLGRSLATTQVQTITAKPRPKRGFGF